MRDSKYKAFSRGVMLARQEFVIYHTSKWVLFPFPPCPFNPYLSPHWSSALILASCLVRVPLRYPRPIAGSLGALLTHRFYPPTPHTLYSLPSPLCLYLSYPTRVLPFPYPHLCLSKSITLSSKVYWVLGASERITGARCDFPMSLILSPCTLVGQLRPREK